MTKIYQLRIEHDDGYYTCGFTVERTEADYALNAWKRWWDRIEELDMLDDPPENIDEMRELLIETIVVACTNKGSDASEAILGDFFESGDYPNFKLIEHELGINWGIGDLVGKMPALEGVK